MKKILIFGASGFLGSNFLKEDVSNYEIWAFVNKHKIKRKDIKLLKCNFKYKELRNFLLKKNLDYILNFSGLSSIEKCEKLKKKAYIANVKNVKIIVDLCKEFNINFLHISSDQFINLKFKTVKASENIRLTPINYYAKTKIQAEKEIIKSKCKYLIIRTSFFGWSNRKNDKKNLLEQINSHKTKKINLWSDVYSTPVYIKTLIKIINIFIKYNVNKQIFNVSSNEIYSKYDLGYKFVKLMNLNPKKIIYSKFKLTKNIIKRPFNMSLSNKKLLKYFPKLQNDLSINKMIKTMVKNK